MSKRTSDPKFASELFNWTIQSDHNSSLSKNSIRSQQFPFNFAPFFTPVFPISWHWNENNLFSISFNVFNIFDLIFQTNKHETNNAMCLILTKNKLRMNYNFNKAIIIYAQQWSGVPHPLRVSVSCFLKIFVLLFENICHIFFKYLITCFFKNICRCASN